MKPSAGSRVISRVFPAGAATPMAVMRKFLATEAECFLLESVEGRSHVARYSFMGLSPRARITFTGNDITIEEEGRVTRRRGDPFGLVHDYVTRDNFNREGVSSPFSAGAVGYLAYDAARLRERIPDRHASASKIPDGLFLVFDSILVFDHVQGEIHLQSLDCAAPGERGRLEAILQSPGLPASEPFSLDGFLEVTSREKFLRAVARAKDHIAAGDIYQIQLSRRWEGKVAGSAWPVYVALRRINPSPYHFFLRTREAQILGASPEMLVRVRGRKIETRPIAGTYPRGSTPAQDCALEEKFRHDPKERAEHVMLVDLARNDLGRVCEIGSVSVPEFFTVEKYSHVQHLVSSVVGTLRPDVSSIEALAASFPAGTLTGAPKIRAMELIDELEMFRRGLYGGAVGYFDISGDLDSCIAIRTMVVEDGVARVQAAAGIVADSDPEREALETEIKSGALFRAAQEAAGER